MIEIYKTKDFNKYMLHRRETFIEECEKMNNRKATKEDYKLAADYFPLIYNNRNELRKTGYVCWCPHTGFYQVHKTKPA